MCGICDGKSETGVLLDLGEKIRRYGYVMQAVEGDAAEPNWVYTVGLLGHLGHPELLVAGVEAPTAAAIIVGAVAVIEDGTTISSGEDVCIDGLSFGAVDVHATHFHSSVFAMWHRYYDAFGSAPNDPRAVQLLCPPALFCQHHGAAVATLRLDRPAPVESNPRPRRHVRRAQARQRPRR